MTPQYNGGPAFPVPPDQVSTTGDPRDGMAVCAAGTGMTLRDYFAAAAMAAFISNESRVAAMAHATEGQEGIVDFAIALSAYGMADAMLDARKEGA